jgi:hypothetical protein
MGIPAGRRFDDFYKERDQSQEAAFMPLYSG